MLYVGTNRIMIFYITMLLPIFNLILYINAYFKYIKLKSFFLYRDKYFVTSYFINLLCNTNFKKLHLQYQIKWEHHPFLLPNIE